MRIENLNKITWKICAWLEVDTYVPVVSQKHAWINRTIETIFQTFLWIRYEVGFYKIVEEVGSKLAKYR